MSYILYTTAEVLARSAVSDKLEGNQDDPKGIVLSKQLIATDKTFNVGAFAVLLITVLLYALFW